VSFCVLSFLSSSLSFCLICRFSCLLPALRLFLLFDGFLSFFLAFGILVVLHVSWI
jgi:hypothetical protein